jgi:hypothetical protein
MKTILILLAMVLLVSEFDTRACPNTAGEKRASFGAVPGNDWYDIDAKFICQQSTGNYKLQVGISSAGEGGTYAVLVWDLTEFGDPQIYSAFFDETSACSGDHWVSLTNGHEYKIEVELSCCNGYQNVGEHAWAKMCHNCTGS